MGPMLSYAINHEDVVLNRVFGGKTEGFFIDVGASHPIHGSTTKHFSDLGWTGVNIEPLPEMVTLLRQHRPRDIVLAVAVSHTVGKAILYEVNTWLSMSSTFSKNQADQHRANGSTIVERLVEVKTLSEICREYVGNREIDFLSIDVEGTERAVLEGMDFNRWRPRVMVVEATQPETNIPVHEDWEYILLSAGYEFGLFDGINRFYVRREDRKLLDRLQAPANVLDNYRDARNEALVRELEWYRHRYEGLGRCAVLAARGVQSAVNLTRQIYQTVTGWQRW